MLSSSINLQVELEAFAFVDATKARAFNSADVHECVRLTIVTNQKTKAFGSVEELDRPRCLLAGKFTLRRAGLLNRNNFADYLQILRGDFATAVYKIKFEFLALRQPFKASALDSADMNKDVFTACLLLDEPKAFLAIKEFYGAFARTNNLRGHAVAATASAAKAAAITAATITTAETSTVSATVAITTAETAAIIAVTWWREAFVATAEGVKTIFAESVALVPSAPTSSIVTHILLRTLSHCPPSKALATGQYAEPSADKRSRIFNRVGSHYT